MKIEIISVAMVFSFAVGFAQDRPIPGAEALKAIAITEYEPLRIDSLKKVYDKRWSLDFTFGQRFISASYKTDNPDTVTFANFHDRNAFFGLGTSYFISDKFQVGLGLNFSLLPQEIEISSFSFGGNIEGKGSGGLVLDLHISAKYFFDVWEYTRPYAGLELSSFNLTAKGGELSISSLSSSQSPDVNEQKASFNAGQILAGITHRAAPGLMLDFNMGFSRANERDPIGGITSIGGFNTSLTFQFILNHGKNKK